MKKLIFIIFLFLTLNTFCQEFDFKKNQVDLNLKLTGKVVDVYITKTQFWFSVVGNDNPKVTHHFVFEDTPQREDLEKYIKEGVNFVKKEGEGDFTILFFNDSIQQTIKFSFYE